jgi:hypothetical protein
MHLGSEFASERRRSRSRSRTSHDFEIRRLTHLRPQRVDETLGPSLAVERRTNTWPPRHGQRYLIPRCRVEVGAAAPLAAVTTTSGQSAWAPAATRSARPQRLPRSSLTNQATKPSSTPLATTEASSRSAGFKVARRTANIGHAPSARNDAPAAIACARELPSSGRGRPATNRVATPPPARTTRPAMPAGLSPTAVTT